MFVYVLHKNGKPLMPCKPVIARLLLKDHKAKVKHRVPFTIQLLVETTDYTQPVTAGMDTGSKKIGCAAIANGKVVYQSEIRIRYDIPRKMKQRANYRRTRRSRKCGYRKPRWQNRASMRKKGRLAPSIKSKIDSHLREKRQVESLLPVTHWKVETASFDIHKITNPEVKGRGYQEGVQLGFYNLKAYVLHRDGYRCQSRRRVKHAKQLHIHHIAFQSKDGPSTPDNLITLCKHCHEALHAGQFQLKVRGRRSQTKHATQIGIIKARLLVSDWFFEEVFGYETKYQREQVLKLSKSHYADAVSICCEAGQQVVPLDRILYKSHVCNGDYRQTKGKGSAQKIPTGKLFGFRKFDFIETFRGRGFVKGKRSSGYFDLMDIFHKTLFSSVSVHKNCRRLQARRTTLMQEFSL